MRLKNAVPLALLLTSLVATHAYGRTSPIRIGAKQVQVERSFPFATDTTATGRIGQHPVAHRLEAVGPGIGIVLTAPKGTILRLVSAKQPKSAGGRVLRKIEVPPSRTTAYFAVDLPNPKTPYDAVVSGKKGTSYEISASYSE